MKTTRGWLPQQCVNCELNVKEHVTRFQYSLPLNVQKSNNYPHILIASDIYSPSKVSLLLTDIVRCEHK